jgi:hypothetical protein
MENNPDMYYGERDVNFLDEDGNSFSRCEFS